MRVYISVDMEGVAGVAHEDQTDPTDPRHAAEYNRSCRLMTGEANAAIEGALAAKATRILVNDSDNQRVSVFDKEGKFVESWPYPSRGGIAVAADDTVYISDVNAGIVNIVKNGKRIDSVSADRAHGMGIDTDGSIYVSGASRMTVMKITKPGGRAAASGSQR